MRAFVGSEGSTGSVPGTRVSDVGKTACGERESFKVLAGNYALVNGAGQINGLRG